MPKVFSFPDKQRFEFINQGNSAEIFLYGDIGDQFFEGISAEDFIRELKDLGSPSQIDVRINSMGGSVFDGMAIYNALVRHPATIHTHNDGAALSSAATILMAGDKIFIAENAQLMIHQAFGCVCGTVDDLQIMVKKFSDTDNQIADIYAKRTGKRRSETLQLMKDETWYIGQEAVDAGFADSIVENKSIANSGYANLLNSRNFQRHWLQVGTGKKAEGKHRSYNENRIRLMEAEMDRV